MMASSTARGSDNRYRSKSESSAFSTALWDLHFPSSIPGQGAIWLVGTSKSTKHHLLAVKLEGIQCRFKEPPPNTIHIMKKQEEPNRGICKRLTEPVIDPRARGLEGSITQ